MCLTLRPHCGTLLCEGPELNNQVPSSGERRGHTAQVYTGPSGLPGGTAVRAWGKCLHGLPGTSPTQKCALSRYLHPSEESAEPSAVPGALLSSSGQPPEAPVPQPVAPQMERAAPFQGHAVGRAETRTLGSRCRLCGAQAADPLAAGPLPTQPWVPGEVSGAMGLLVPQRKLQMRPYRGAARGTDSAFLLGPLPLCHGRCHEEGHP